MYISPADLVLRMTERVVVRITDDDKDGKLDNPVVQRVIREAEGFCEARIQKVLGEAGIKRLRELGAKAPDEWIRLCVDGAEYMLYGRHPDYVRGKWEERRKLLESDLAGFRMTDLRLPPAADEAAPEPATRGEGFIETTNPDCPEESDHVFLDDMGDYV